MILNISNLILIILRSLGLDYVDTDIPYVQHRILDTPTAPLYNILIDSLTEIHKNLSKGKNVYVHCQAGVSRSSSIVIAYLMKYKQMSLFEAWDITFKVIKNQFIFNFRVDRFADLM